MSLSTGDVNSCSELLCEMHGFISMVRRSEILAAAPCVSWMISYKYDGHVVIFMSSSATFIYYILVNFLQPRS